MRLGLNQDEGEKWIVNLIRDTRVDAKIDYKDGTVVMNHPPQSVYQQVIERTKGGFFRTQVLRYVAYHAMDLRSHRLIYDPVLPLRSRGCILAGTFRVGLANALFVGRCPVQNRRRAPERHG